MTEASGPAAVMVALSITVASLAILAIVAAGASVAWQARHPRTRRTAGKTDIRIDDAQRTEDGLMLRSGDQCFWVPSEEADKLTTVRDREHCG
jgi:hypothetical protein